MADLMLCYVPGPQIGWGTVFLAEYAGPIFMYLIFYTGRTCTMIYPDSKGAPSNFVQKLVNLSSLLDGFRIRITHSNI